MPGNSNARPERSDALGSRGDLLCFVGRELGEQTQDLIERRELAPEPSFNRSRIGRQLLGRHALEQVGTLALEAVEGVGERGA